MKLNKLIYICATSLLLAAGACSDDDTVLAPLGKTNGANEAVSYSSLTFKWDRVENAMQYGYQLAETSNLESPVNSGVVDTNTVSFTDLKPGTDYTLKVWAYGAYGEYAKSEPVVMTGRTDDLIAAGKPAPVFEQLEGDTNAYINWDATENANSYSYRLESSGTIVAEGETTETSLTFESLATGDYTFTITAVNTDPGYTSSEPAVLEFHYQKPHIELWRMEGTYISVLLGKEWRAEIAAYYDDTYEILGWYGVEGYNICFSVDANNPGNSFHLVGDYSYNASTGCYSVATGLADPDFVNVYPTDNYSSFEGNQDAGTVKLNVLDKKTGDYLNDTFHWSATEEPPSEIDFLLGKWNLSMSGTTYMTDDGKAMWFDQTEEIEITKVDNTTVAMPALYFTDEIVYATVNLEDRTLTIEPTTVWEWYTFANNDEGPVIGYIQDDNTITFVGWNAWYSGWNYFDMENVSAKIWR